MKKVQIDMDEVMCDFSGSKDLPPNNKIYSPPQMYVPGFFSNLEPVRGSHEVIHQLIRDGFEVEILTQPVAMSPCSYTEKAQWILKHFPVLGGKVNMTQDKGNFVSAYLIDDNIKWKIPFEKNGGKFIHFDLAITPERMWKNVYQTICQLEEENDNDSKTTTSL